MREELLQEAFRKYGTPLYVFDLDLLKEQTDRIRAGFGTDISLCYAMKANPFLTGYMAQWADRIEVCSMGEFRICRRLQVPSEKLFISGVMKKRDDIREILSYCGNKCAYTVESPLHFQYFAEWSEEHPEDGVLRLYPRLTSGNQFGMDEDTVLEILNKEKELAYLDEFLKKAAEEQMDVRCLEYGSGTAVPYFRDKTAETFEEAGLKGLQDAVKGMQWKGHVTVELGRALAAMCGYYLTKVEDTKTSDGIHYCIVDGGCHQLNYDGQIKGMYEPYVKVLPKEVSVKVAEVSKNKNAEEKTWKVCGSLCTLNDVLCNEITLKGLEKGAILVFERTGAYSAMEGMALFLSHELPGVVLYSKEEGWIQARVQQETYKLNMVE